MKQTIDEKEVAKRMKAGNRLHFDRFNRQFFFYSKQGIITVDTDTVRDMATSGTIKLNHHQLLLQTN